MSKILLLDCTLRDGGYVNDWNFGERGIAEMLDALAASRVDAIEVGFLVDGNADDPARTRFSSVEKMAAAFPRGKPAGTLAFGMVVFGKYPIEKIPPRERGGIDGIRVTFKKNERAAALEFCRRAQELGYLVSVNPTGADAYGDREFLEIVESVNAMRPFAFAIVDTLGAMKRRDVARLCMLIDHNLHPDVALCFHSHNNTFIIDTCVFGMGRGAGNLCTELMMRHLNDRTPGRYDLIPVLRVIDERVNRIFARTPWGYSVPYYLAAVNRCHPNYASFLLSKQTLPVTGIDTSTTSPSSSSFTCSIRRTQSTTRPRGNACARRFPGESCWCWRRGKASSRKRRPSANSSKRKSPSSSRSMPRRRTSARISSSSATRNAFPNFPFPRERRSS